MYKIRFWVLALVSFITAIVATFFVPGTFWNRGLSVAYCTIFSVNSTFCAANLGRSPDEYVIAANPIQQDVRMHYEQTKPNLKQLDKTDDTILAFKPNQEKYGHIPITKEALGREDFKFQKPAIDEIVAANRAVDLKPGSDLRTSEDFDIPLNHFDNERFQEGSQRLINLKKNIIEILKPIKDTNNCDDSNNSNDRNTKEEVQQKGMQARKLLGGALHTLQDFYAHTNWVELGHPGIDERLGKEVIPNPDPNTPTSPEVEQVMSVEGYPDIKVSTTDSGRLLPDFMNQPNDPQHHLTSGYFISLTSPCEAPPGKTRHGGFTFICPDGLSKDEPGRPGYQQAYNLAVTASVDYINQILQDPAIRSNYSAIKALMGITEEKSNSCEKKQAPTETPKGNYKQGKSYGDPHLITFDGLSYSFQTVGEFILVKSNDGKFEVQVRHTPVNSSLSLNSAVAMKVNSDRVAFYSKDFPDSNTSTSLRINGKPTVIQGDSLSLPDGNTIAKSGDTYVVNFSTGEKVVVDTAQFGGNFYFNVSPFVLDSQPERYGGLLGNVNGNPKDDQKIRGGGVLSSKSTYGNVKQVLNLVGVGQLPVSLDAAEKVYFDQLYKNFTNSWRISQKESLFDYLPNKTTENYTDRKFPDEYLKLEMLSSEQVKKARSACETAKVTQDMMEGCIFDVGFTGFSEFARTTAKINGYVETLNKLFPSLNIPTSQRVIDNTIDRVKPKVCVPFVGCL